MKFARYVEHSNMAVNDLIKVKIGTVYTENKLYLPSPPTTQSTVTV